MKPTVDLVTVMRRVQEGDRAAFADLYDALAADVYGVVVRTVRDPAMSEEVTQEVFVEVWRKARTYDARRGGVRGWAVTIARRRAVDRVRREQVRRDRTNDLAVQRQPPAPGPEDLAAASDDAEQLERALAELPAEQRLVIELAFVDGHPHGAIAEQLGLPLGTVKGRVRGGLRRLRGRLGTDR